MNTFQESGTGQNHIIFLDRIPVTCPGSTVLRQFRYVNDASFTLHRYLFTCTSELSSNMVCTAVPGATANFFSGWSHGNTNFLDRLHPDCGTHGAINDFRLINLGNYIFRYDLICCKPAGSTLECSTLNTALNDGGNWISDYLDRHNVACPPETVIKSFRLLTGPGIQMKYSYDCCSIVLP